jgi:cell division protein FtsB
VAKERADRTDRLATKPAPKASLARRGRRVVRYVLAFVTVVIVIDAVVGDKGLLTLLKARRDFEGVEASLAKARSENAKLRDEARRLREDPSAIEEIARRELGLIKPGETLFIIRDVPNKPHQ